MNELCVFCGKELGFVAPGIYDIGVTVIFNGIEYGAHSGCLENYKKYRKPEHPVMLRNEE